MTAALGFSSGDPPELRIPSFEIANPILKGRIQITYKLKKVFERKLFLAQKLPQARKIHGGPFTMAIDFGRYRFSPVINLPKTFEVYDFTQSYDPNRMRSGEYGIGRYDEKRRGMYTTELFAGKRDIHIGIDIAAPLGTDVMAFYPGEILLSGYNAAPGDYGATIITSHILDDQPLYALYGHLSKKSLEHATPGRKISAGEVIAWIGDKHENGGWNPHLHFQLSLVKPTVPDLPGAVSDEDREQALKIYPDPRLVLGNLY